MNEQHFSDFYKVPDITFDIKKLRAELDRVLKQKKFNTLGISNFAAIPINRIPGDADSIKGHNVRGTYWTFPDESGKEVRSCLLYTSPSPRDLSTSRMPSSA